jgi:hypothetical protein
MAQFVGLVVVRPTPRPSASGVVLMGGTSTKAHRSWWAGPSTLALLFGGVRGWIGSVRCGGGSLAHCWVLRERAGDGLSASVRTTGRSWVVPGVVRVGSPVA